MKYKKRTNLHIWQRMIKTVRNLLKADELIQLFVLALIQPYRYCDNYVKIYI